MFSHKYCAVVDLEFAMKTMKPEALPAYKRLWDGEGESQGAKWQIENRALPTYSSCITICI